MEPPDTCPNCGADIPAGAKACPECGADERTGWSDEARTAGLDLPDNAFDYEEFVKREFPSGRKPVPYGVHRFWWLVAIGLVALLILGIVRITF
jgi:hypothetical protein